MFKNKKRKKFRRRVFFSFLVIEILMFIIFGGITYVVYMDETQKRSDMSMDSVGERVRKTLEDVMTGMREYYIGISDDDGVQWLLEQDNVPYESYSGYIDAQKMLQGNYSITEYIKAYTFINRKTGWLLSGTGMYPLQDLNNREEVELFLEGQEKELASIYWLNNMRETEASETLHESRRVDLNGMLLVECFRSTGMDRGVLIVQLDMDRLRTLINNVKEDYEVCLYSREKKLLYSSNEELYEDSRAMVENWDGRDDIKNVQGGDGDGYRMNLYTSTRDGVYCVVGYNTSQLTESGEQLLIILLCFGIGFSAIVVICFYISRRISKPVNELMRSMRNVLGGEEEIYDEFLFLENGVEELANNHNDMLKLIHFQERRLMELFMDHMIRGELSQEEINTNLQRFGIEGEAYYRLLAVVCLLEDGNDAALGDLEREAVNMMVVRQIPESLGEELFLPPVCYGEEILLLVGAEDSGQMTDRVMSVYNKMMDYVQKNYKLSAAVGGSQIFHMLKHMKTAYNEAIETLRNETTTLYFDENAVAFYEDFADRKYVKNVYDTVGEKKLLDALNQCDREEVHQLLEAFMKRIRDAKVVRHERSYYLNRLLISMLNVLSDAGIAVNQIFNHQTQDLFIAASKTYNTDNFRSFLENVADSIMKALAEFRRSDVLGIREQVVELIRESRGSITLSECAQRLGYHPSYIWKILKTEGNQNFTELINLEKLELAKQMLSNSTDSVAEIAVKLGYSNTQNFIRFFSKYVGMTPGKFRKEGK